MNRASFEAAMDKLDKLLESGNPEEVLAAFDAALALSPAPHLILAKAQYLKAQRRPGPALACLEQVLAADPRLVDAWFEMADLLETTDQLQASLTAYDQAIALEPHHAQALCDRGHVLGRLRRMPEALASYAAAVRIDPTCIPGWFNKGSAEAALGHPAEARVSFERFLALNPSAQFADAVKHAHAVLAKL